MVTSMRESGKMTKLMEREFTPKMMVRVILVNGSKIFNMVSGLRGGLTVHHTKGRYSMK